MGVTGRIDGPDFRPSGTSVIWDIGHLGLHRFLAIVCWFCIKPKSRLHKATRRDFEDVSTNQLTGSETNTSPSKQNKRRQPHKLDRLSS